MIFAVAPCFSSAFFIVLTSFASKPSATRNAILRRFNRVFDRVRHRKRGGFFDLRVFFRNRLIIVRICVRRITHIHRQIEFCRNLDAEIFRDAVARVFRQFDSKYKRLRSRIEVDFDFAEFETDRVDDMRLFIFRLAVEKQSGLREMIAETVAARADFMRVDFFLDTKQNRRPSSLTETDSRRRACSAHTRRDLC